MSVDRPPIAQGAISIGSLCLAISIIAAGTAAGEGYRFILPRLDAKPGDTVSIAVSGDYERSAQGFVMAARYPSSELSIRRVTADDTILGALEVDFFDVTIDPAAGVLVVSALIDTSPPFDGDLIPALGFPLDLFHIEAAVSPEARGELTIALEDGLSSPPVANLFTVDNETVPVTELTSGTILVTGDDAQTIAGAAFIRGDGNLSGEVNIADAVASLLFIFSGEGTLPCQDAADANDDEALDISDPIWVLEFLFNGGAPPPPPYEFPGPDPTPGALGCQQPLPAS